MNHIFSSNPDEVDVLLVGSLLIVKDEEESVDIELLECGGVLKESWWWCLRIIRWCWIWVLGCLGPIQIKNGYVRTHERYINE